MSISVSILLKIFKNLDQKTMTTLLLVYYIYIILVDIFTKLTIRISNHNFTRVGNSNRPIVFLDNLRQLFDFV